MTKLLRLASRPASTLRSFVSPFFRPAGDRAFDMQRKQSEATLSENRNTPSALLDRLEL